MVIKNVHNIVTGESAKGIYENGELKLVALERNFDEFVSEVENGENECEYFISKCVGGAL